jgi:general secretion pathway protein A
MYKKFFSLTRNPFDLTPDPGYYVPTARHDEALATLHYGVRQQKGFVVVTGEAGTGKTLMLRCLLRMFTESKDIAYAYLFNGRLSPLEFLQYIVADFGHSSAGKNKGELLMEFGRFVAERGAQKQTTILIVDEAHHLPEEILEEIRLLTNLEMAEQKLLQIILVGQPELDRKLDGYNLRQLKQRIALRSYLGPLDIEETAGYIEHRLKTAGLDATHEPIFTTEAIAAVHRFSRGLPRLINTICENSLVSAYARQSRVVTPEIVEDVSMDFRLENFPQAQRDPARADLRSVLTSRPLPQKA